MSARIADPAVTPQLRDWIVAQERAGRSREDLVQAMCASGWDAAVALRVLHAVMAPSTEASAEASAEAAAAAMPTPPALPGPQLAGAWALLPLCGRPVQRLLSLRQPKLALFGGFLDDAECDALVALARPRLGRSRTVAERRGGSEVNAARTSDGMFFERGETALIDRIEQRIAALLHWPVRCGEGLQVLRYGPGTEYLPHFDYFDPAQPGSKAVLARGGQRVATLIMYLHAPQHGGATVFPDAGIEVAPVKGHALYFAYERPHPSTGTLHGGAPVLEGEKWVATKWLREREFA